MNVFSCTLYMRATQDIPFLSMADVSVWRKAADLFVSISKLLATLLMSLLLPLWHSNLSRGKQKDLSSDWFTTFVKYRQVIQPKMTQGSRQKQSGWGVKVLTFFKFCLKKPVFGLKKSTFLPKIHLLSPKCKFVWGWDVKSPVFSSERFRRFSPFPVPPWPRLTFFHC